MNKRILSLLDQLNSYVSELKAHLPASLKEYKTNIEKQRFVERTLQLAIEVCIDVSQHILKDMKLGLPDEEENLFDKLQNAEVISEEMSNKLKEMKKFRNVLIHRYTKLDNALIFHNAKENSQDFLDFKKEILKK